MGQPFWNGPNLAYQTRTAFDNMMTYGKLSALSYRHFDSVCSTMMTINSTTGLEIFGIELSFWLVVLCNQKKNKYVTIFLSAASANVPSRLEPKIIFLLRWERGELLVLGRYWLWHLHNVFHISTASRKRNGCCSNTGRGEKMKHQTVMLLSPLPL